MVMSNHLHGIVGIESSGKDDSEERGYKPVPGGVTEMSMNILHGNRGFTIISFAMRNL